MIKLKRIMTLVLCLIVTLAFSACSQFANETVFSGLVELDESGIVRKSVLNKLKNDNAVLTIEGKDGDIRYQWTVFGSDIASEKDTDMSVHVTLLENESFHIELNSTESFGFTPIISVYIPEMWSSLTATVFDANGESLCGASITGGNPTIVNFTVSDGVFEYVVKGDMNAEALITENTSETALPAPENENDVDAYLSKPSSAPKNGATVSDGTSTKQDKYKTDPVPEGKQEPVEPENQQVDESVKWHCIFSIECSTVLNNLGDLEPSKLDVLPSDGIILKKVDAEFNPGESVFDVLQRVCRENSIHLEASWTPMYNSAYIEGIHNLYEFDCGELSGWMYRVNGWYPNYGCSRYALCDGDTVEWRYTCDLGRDIGCKWNMQGMG